MDRIPLPVRAILAAGRGAAALCRASAAVRDEVLLALVAPQQRDAVTADIYSRAGEYLPAGVLYEHGLFSWEKALLERPEVPRRARVLLVGAGGGRELKELLARGHEVDAFEPAERLCAACRALAAKQDRARVAQGTYADLVRFARDGQGPLEGFGKSYDLVWLGWGSFTHVTVTEDQAAVLGSIRSLAPAAPVVLSYFLEPAAPQRTGRIWRLRLTLRRILGLLGGASPSRSVEYWPGVGFTYTFSETELRSLFRASGYSVAVFEQEPYAHALLVPGNVSGHRIGA